LTLFLIYDFIDRYKDEKIKLILDRHTEHLKTFYEVLSHNQETTANLIFDETMENKKLVEILQKANLAKDKNDSNQLNNLRDEAKNIVNHKYEHYKRQGVLQYHFVFPDNRSFLRMHKPDKYGDDLTLIRKDYANVNKTLRPIRGFAQGRVAHGFRNVYPIIDDQKNHLGAVEVSFSSEILQHYFQDLNRLHTHFLIRKDIFDAKTWSKDELVLKYKVSSENDKFMATVVKNDLTKDCGKKLELIKDKIDALIKKGDNFSVYLLGDKDAKVVSFYPVSQSITKEKVAWIVSYTSDPIVYEAVSYSKFMRYVVFVALVILFLFIYFLVNQKTILESKIQEKTKELNKYLNIVNKHVLISMTDRKGIITYANDDFSKTCGYSVDELIGSPHNIVRHEDMPKEVYRDMWKTLKSGNEWRGQVKNKKKNGDEYWIDTVISPNFNQFGNIEGYTSVRVDITDKIKLKELTEYQDTVIKEQVEVANKERDKAKKYAAAKSEFLANMSHEIRTPLNAILGFVHILQKSEDDDLKLKYLNIIDKSSNSLLSIINDILDFSKIESGKIEVDNTDFDSIEEFETISELFKGGCQEKKLEFIIDVDKDIPKYLNCDIQKIRQVVSNLLSNAIKFTSSGKKVELNVYYDNDEQQLYVYVKDQGIGIPQNRQENIFEAFTQADSSTVRKFGGTGLGLSISSAFIKKLGGILWLESKEGEGSKFYFSIPCKSGNKPKENIDIDQDKELKGKLLVVEDNQANQMFMKVLLKKIGLEFEIANDGLEAIDMYKANSYDLILMDENMPNLNGIEATKRIRQYEKENDLIYTPIVAITANALKGDRERFLASGMDEYLTKPLKPSELKEVLHKLL
jgi:PAS domain S-box-containing protein